MCRCVKILPRVTELQAPFGGCPVDEIPRNDVHEAMRGRALAWPLTVPGQKYIEKHLGAEDKPQERPELYDAIRAARRAPAPAPAHGQPELLTAGSIHC